MNPRRSARAATVCLIGIVFLLNLLTVLASGQRMDREEVDVVQTRAGETLVRLAVFAESLKTHLDRQSVVKITNESTHDVSWATTNEKSEAALGLPFGKYEIEVSAVGYLSER